MSLLFNIGKRREGYFVSSSIVSGLVPINVIADSFLPMSLSE